jgi:hypothetical protein
MNRVNVFSFYKLGALLQCAEEIKSSTASVTALLIVDNAAACLADFLRSNEAGLRRSRESALLIKDKLGELEAKLREGRPVEDHAAFGLWGAVEDFGAILESESQDDLRIFAVMPKGSYDRKKLVDRAEAILGETTLSIIPKEIANEVNLAGRCLAFDLWTAAGFHAMRAVEAMARRYYEVVTGNPPIDRVPLGGVIAELEKRLEREEGTKVSESRLGLIIAGLRRLVKMYRIPIIHPQMSLTPESAQEVFEMAASVIPMICKDIRFRTV